MQIQSVLVSRFCLGDLSRNQPWRLFSLWIAGVAVTLLAACGGGGSSTATTVVPAMPTGMVVTAGNSEASISWGAVAGATSYNIYRSTSQGQQGIKVGASSTPSYVDATALNDATYYYEVTADNAAGEGPVSPQSAGVTPVLPVAVPAAPSGFTATQGNALGGRRT